MQFKKNVQILRIKSIGTKKLRFLAVCELKEKVSVTTAESKALGLHRMFDYIYI